MNQFKLNHFSIFVVLYMTSFFLEMTEKWRDPFFTLASFILVSIAVFFGPKYINFIIFLILSTAYFIFLKFPDVANHVNLFIYCNIVMMVGLVYLFFKSRNFFLTDGEAENYFNDQYFELIKPNLRITWILVYFLAGFHKLNSDFFNLETSCAVGFFYRILSTIQADLFGWFIGLMLVFTLMIISYKIIIKLLNINYKANNTARVQQFIIILLISILALFILINRGKIVIPEEFRFIYLLPISISVIVWEMIGGLLLIFARFQGPIILLSWFMHAVLSMIAFVDFAGLAVPMLMSFFPIYYWNLVDSHITLPFGQSKIHRVYIYFILNAIGGVFSGIYYHFYPTFNIKVVSAILFNLAALILVWPVIYEIFISEKKQSWQGVPIINRKMPKFMYVFAICLFCFGMTSYLGLRTAGNFSMFSNLRTEAGVSNHLILKHRPLKFWNYQDDVVYFIDIDNKFAAAGYNLYFLKGKKLPKVEFEKLIYKWNKAGYEVPVKFEYRGKIISTKDITKDPNWSVNNRSWQMMTMDFRAIQPSDDEPNRCRW